METSGMLSIEGLAYRRIADAKVGNLIYVIDNDGADLALCIEHPPGATGGDPTKAVLRLLGNTPHGRMPIVDTATSRCIDWGVRPIVRWQYPLAVQPRTLKDPLQTGYLVLVGDKPAISSHYAGGRGDRMYWNVLTGKPVEPGQADFIFLTQWTLGATGADGSFLMLASYPDDFGKTG